jgi:small basic protein
MWLPALGLLVGVVIGLMFSVSVPASAAPYTAMAILAALDSILGAARAELEHQYDGKTFLSGLITNMLLASMLTYVGDRLGVPLNNAAIVAFGVRVFTNLAQIRRLLLGEPRGVRPTPFGDPS